MSSKQIRRTCDVLDKQLQSSVPPAACFSSLAGQQPPVNGGQMPRRSYSYPLFTPQEHCRDFSLFYIVFLSLLYFFSKMEPNGASKVSTFHGFWSKVGFVK